MGEYWRSKRMRLCEHESEGLGNDEVGTESAQCAANFPVHALLWLRAEELDARASRAAVRLVAGVTDDQTQIGHLALQGAEGIQSEGEPFVRRGEKNQLALIDRRAVRSDRIVHGVVDGERTRSAADAETLQGRLDAGALCIRHTHGRHGELTEELRDRGQGAGAFRARMNPVMQPQVNACLRILLAQLRQRPWVAVDYEARDAGQSLRAAVAPEVLGAVVLDHPGTE